MAKCPWEAIPGFRSADEFERFGAWLESQVAERKAVRVPVRRRYQDVGFEEAWFKHVDSGQVWRLVSPDFPFTGLFRRVRKFLLWFKGDR